MTALKRTCFHTLNALWQHNAEQNKADSLDSTLICSVIGTHTGPGVVAVAFFKKG